MTDPDASVTRHSGRKSKLRYKTHRVIDEKKEIITATKVTPGSEDDGHVLQEMIETHEQNTQMKLETAVADSKYGTIENFLECHDREVKAHIPSIEDTHKDSGRRKGIFPKEAFSYNPDTDTFTCPAGKVLKKIKLKKPRKHYEYKAFHKDCKECHIRNKCTRSKFGRTLKRHARQDDLDLIIKESKSRESKKDLKTRQHLLERSFARSTRYGFKRARWRNLWRMEIQDYLIAAIQNITVLINQPIPRLSKSDLIECQKGGHQGRYWTMDRVVKWLMSFCSRKSLSFNPI